MSGLGEMEAAARRRAGLEETGDGNGGTVGKRSGEDEELPATQKTTQIADPTTQIILSRLPR